MKNLNRNTLRRNGALAALSLLVVSLLLSGCAGPPRWGGEMITDSRAQRSAALLNAVAVRDAACPPTMIADLTVGYTSPLEEKKLRGFLQFSLPENYKFIITNPLGQMVWGVAGDRKHYQALNTIRKQYIEGGMNSLVLRNRMPIFLARSNWGQWLTGRIRYGAERIVDVRQDKETDGIWITVKTDSAEGPLEHLLLDQAGVLHRRTITDRDNEELVSISYSRLQPLTARNPEYRESAARCLQPEQISVSGLPWGSHIDLQLTNLESRNTAETYTLPVPPRYFRQYRP